MKRLPIPAYFSYTDGLLISLIRWQAAWFSPCRLHFVVNLSDTNPAFPDRWAE